MRRKQTDQGFTLIEVLIALVVLAVGLLGMATLMTTSLQSNQSAYRRSQASLLTYDLVERMRLNRSQAITSDDYTLSEDSDATSAPSCDAAGCTPHQQAQLDMSQWRAALEAAIPGASAEIGRDVNHYTVTISWDEVGSEMKNASNESVTPSFSLRIDL
ncbi:type IV pilus modification protein PilV [Pseudomonas citronellolis]|uniref:type IV pilus modification protein PilV n=1 Tax=Pseudomonas citronellolis TaxID=53408 RepID=UPI002112CB75|nr:type IV pilus modification protein PilV [Pseudomonas citronellolis]UUC51272.1 type IV pilus modification protein PilV [Pseudomonas citronellolis]